ncbi:hypothetical protein RHSIM_Rhsim01G0202800 [Rhododendron simsii]|uniref:Uncharacterized protein n=1 Tax=Rhododendron simsii TaxID=118357 RepID=A0A834HEV6_RHOSS|nr:hypothetical protein RHSIM_Rhsim01G0202800 [Rhododendron simsii]
MDNQKHLTLATSVQPSLNPQIAKRNPIFLLHSCVAPKHWQLSHGFVISKVKGGLKLPALKIWYTPSQGTFKRNVDATVDDHVAEVGIGMLTRDHGGCEHSRIRFQIDSDAVAIVIAGCRHLKNNAAAQHKMINLIPSRRMLDDAAKSWCMGNSSAINKLWIHDMNRQGTALRCLTSHGKNIIKINQLPTIVSKDQRGSFGFATLSTIEEPGKAVEMFNWYLDVSSL